MSLLWSSSFASRHLWQSPNERERKQIKEVKMEKWPNECMRECVRDGKIGCKLKRERTSIGHSCTHTLSYFSKGQPVEHMPSFLILCAGGRHIWVFQSSNPGWKFQWWIRTFQIPLNQLKCRTFETSRVKLVFKHTALLQTFPTNPPSFAC